MKTTSKEIVDYWMMREYERGLGFDWAEAHEKCLRKTIVIVE